MGWKVITQGLCFCPDISYNSGHYCSSWLPPCSGCSLVECESVGCPSLFREFFIRQSRTTVLVEWRNWRKQKIRRAVNKSTQKLILSRANPEANMAAAVHFLPEGRPNDGGDNCNAKGGRNSEVQLYLYVLQPTTSTTANLYRNLENIKLISIEREEIFHEASYGCRRMQWLERSGWKIQSEKFLFCCSCSRATLLVIDLNRSTFLIADFGSSKPRKDARIVREKCLRELVLNVIEQALIRVPNSRFLLETIGILLLTTRSLSMVYIQLRRFIHHHSHLQHLIASR